MTVYNLALRIKEIADPQQEFDQTHNHAVLDQISEQQLNVSILVDNIINTYHVPEAAG